MKEKGVYKKVYSGEWANGTLREKRVKELLEREGVKVEWHGLGAGREDYIPQSARELGYEIGDPDLKATTRSGREVYIEVSGTSKINENSDIWIRPDKLENVIKTGKDTWFVHVLSASQEIASQEIMMRCIHLTPNLCKDLLADESRKRELKKKEVQEKYIAIRSTEQFVRGIRDLIRTHLKKVVKRGHSDEER